MGVAVRLSPIPAGVPWVPKSRVPRVEETSRPACLMNCCGTKRLGTEVAGTLWLGIRGSIVGTVGLLHCIGVTGGAIARLGAWVFVGFPGAERGGLVLFCVPP